MRGKLILTLILVSSILIPSALAVTKFELDLSQGNIPGMSVWHKFGENPAVIGNGYEIIWPGGNATYPYLTTARLLSISSSDINDDVGDTGLWNVTIWGLDADWILQNETIQMDGQNGVNTTNTYIRIFRMQGRNAGATRLNEGTIYAGYGPIVGGVPNNILGVIDDDEHAQSQMAMFTVPENTTGYISSFYYSTDNDQKMEFELQIRDFGEIFAVKHEIYLRRQIWSTQPDFVPLRVESRSDIQMMTQYAKGDAVSGGFTIILIKDGFGDYNETVDIGTPIDIDQSTNNGLLYLLLALILILAIAFRSK